MKDYKIKIKIISPMTSYFYSDTFSGLLMYLFALKDKDIFDYFYQSFINKNPPFVFSSLLPAGFLPFNINFIINKYSDYTKDDKKALKKINYLPVDWINNLASKKIKDFKDLAKQILFKKQIRFHNNIEEKQLFFIDNLYFLNNNQAELYLRIFDKENEKKIIEKTFEAIDFYLGKKKTSGYNNFKIESIDELAVPNYGDYFLSLSAFNPDHKQKNDYLPLVFDFKTKYPKVGEFFAGNNPFKKKIILINEGSVFKSYQSLSYVGEIIKNISYAKEEFIQISLTIPFYFNYE